MRNVRSVADARPGARPRLGRGGGGQRRRPVRGLSAGASSAIRRSSTRCAAWDSCCGREPAEPAGPPGRRRRRWRSSSRSPLLGGALQPAPGSRAARVAGRHAAPAGRRHRPAQRLGARAAHAPGGARRAARRPPAHRADRRPARADRGALGVARRADPARATPSRPQAIAGDADGYRDATLSGEPVRLYVAPLPGTRRRGRGRRRARGVQHRRDRPQRQRPAPAHRVSALIAARARGARRRAADRARACVRSPPVRGRGAAIEATGDPSRRLPVPASRDEVAELARDAQPRCSTASSGRADAERRFLADASHELRTPLTSLRGNAAFVAPPRRRPRGARRHRGRRRAARAPARGPARARARGGGGAAPVEEIDLAALARGGRRRRPRRTWSRTTRSGCAASAARSSARWATSSRTPASTARPAGRSPSTLRRATAGALSVSDEGPGLAPPRSPSARSALLARRRRPPTVPGPGSAWRSCGPPPSATAAGSPGRRRRA